MAVRSLESDLTKNDCANSKDSQEVRVGEEGGWAERATRSQASAPGLVRSSARAQPAGQGYSFAVLLDTSPGAYNLKGQVGKRSYC